MKKIMMLPWVEKSWAKWFGSTSPGELTAKACCVRINTASISARLSITPAITMYIMPIFLWSRLVNHSVHR